ncbi:MAG: DUF1016 family protein, partial [Propionibacteriaceae bacterium]|nr:DUF1016 family protein [Propionibacteriaceae bacterium]
QLPWGHNLVLLTKLKAPEMRLAYAQAAIEHGWSRNVLNIHIETRRLERSGQAITNFVERLPAPGSDLAQQSLKDPYLFDFLDVGSEADEREIESALVKHITQFLLELGAGFAFVGRQVHLEVGGDDFFIDLLFFHVEQLRYVVIELKAKKFDPRDAGQLGFYVALIEDQLRRPQHQPTVGMLLVADKNDSVVRYALAGTTQPIAVSRYQLSSSVQAALPSEDAITRAVAIEFHGRERELTADSGPHDPSLAVVWRPPDARDAIMDA